MSNRKLIDPSIVTGIADAIRTKKGTTATIKVSELADEIASIPTGGMADSTKELVNVVSGVTPTDEISLNNGIASGVVDTPSVQSWADTRTTADGGTIKDGIAYIKAIRGKSFVVDGNVLNSKQKSVISRTCKKTIDLGTLSWSYYSASGHRRFTTSGISSNAKETAFSEIADLNCAIYKADSWSNIHNNISDKTIGIAGTTLGVYDSRYTDASAFKTAMSGVMLTYESTDYTTLDTLTLPTLTAFPNGLCGVGTAYDEVSLAEGKATKRMAELVLKGTESWYVGNATNKAFKCAFSVKSAVTDGSIKANAICASLAVSTTNNVYNGTIGFGLNKFEIWLKDGVSESVDALKANLAANPVHIFYEVAEPTESTFTPCRAYYKASNNGQETATAEEATAPFTAEIGYIDYVPINPVSVQSEEESPILADE